MIKATPPPPPKYHPKHHQSKNKPLQSNHPALNPPPNHHQTNTAKSPPNLKTCPNAGDWSFRATNLAKRGHECPVPPVHWTGYILGAQCCQTNHAHFKNISSPNRWKKQSLSDSLSDLTLWFLWQSPARSLATGFKRHQCEALSGDGQEKTSGINFNSPHFEL